MVEELVGQDEGGVVVGLLVGPVGGGGPWAAVLRWKEERNEMTERSSPTFIYIYVLYKKNENDNIIVMNNVVLKL